MKRASYRQAIAWIAEYDSGLSEGALQATGSPDAVSELITSLLVADIFDVEPEKVGKDVVKYRKQHGWEDETEKAKRFADPQGK